MGKNYRQIKNYYKIGQKYIFDGHVVQLLGTKKCKIKREFVKTKDCHKSCIGSLQFERFRGDYCSVYKTSGNPVFKKVRLGK